MSEYAADEKGVRSLQPVLHSRSVRYVLNVTDQSNQALYVALDLIGLF